MARRPLHLRWIYVQDHARLFIALGALTLLAIIAAGILLSDPARGLAFGAVPVIFGGVVWILTNQAGYPNRDPESLAHERPTALEPAAPTTDNAPAGAEQWDPFAEQRMAAPPSPAAETATAPGDPFEQPPQLGDTPEGKPPATTSGRRPPNGEDEPTPEPPAKLRPRPWEDEPTEPKESPKADDRQPRAGKKPEAPAGRSEPEPSQDTPAKARRLRPWDDESPAKKAPPDRRKAAAPDKRTQRVAAASTGAGEAENRQADSTPKKAQPGSSSNKSKAAAKRQTAPTTGTGDAIHDRKQQARTKKAAAAQASRSAAEPPPAKPDGSSAKDRNSPKAPDGQPADTPTGDTERLLTPAEAAIRDAAARKTKKRRKTG